MTAPSLYSEFERTVTQLMVQGFDRATAEREVRRQFPLISPPPPDLMRTIRAENVREKEEQAYISKLFRGFGCRVYNLSQARATKQTPGLPDLWVTHRERGLAFWFEVKRQQGGRLSEAQREFRHECTAAHVSHYVGDRRDAAHALVQLDLARVGDGPCGIVPFHEGRP
jgi:hypothetical protein